MELLEIFDSNGNMTGKTIEREHKKELKGGEYFAVAVIFIENSQGDFLIQKTSERKGGNYSSTGGHVDRGEMPINTIKREVKEEIGLEIENEEIVELGFIVRKHSLAFMYYLKKDVDIHSLKLQESEVARVQYMNVESIRKLIENEEITKSHGIIFEKILESLNINQLAHK